MTLSTRGIVFNKFKYAESSLVVKIFTEELGLQSYIVKGIGSKTARLKLSLFQPLSLLALVVYHKPNHGLQYIREARMAYQWQHIPFSSDKQSILMLLNEVLYKTTRQESPDKELFQWIYHVMVWFDLEEKNFLNFHLFFLMQFTRFLGFSPKKEIVRSTSARFFDMQEGLFVTHKPFHSYYLKNQQADNFFELVQMTLEGLKTFRIDNRQRRNLLDALLSYYQLHLPELGKIKSLDVLRAINASG